MNKFRKEKYIEQIYSERTKTWSFRVRYGTIKKVFNEKNYLSSSQAFRKAIDYRNRLMCEVDDSIVPNDVTIQECYESINDIYVLRSETKRKLDCFYQKYISTKDVPIRKLTRADILGDLNRMVEDCTNDTITRVFSIYRKCFGVALANNYISKDITLQITPPKSRKIKANKRLELTSEELLIQLQKVSKKHLKSSLERNQFGLIPLALLYTGMRPAELFALNKDDVDLKRKLIHVNKEVGSDRDDTDVIRQCKTDMSVRDIPMSEKAIDIFKQAMALTDSELVFPTKFGNHYVSTDIGNRLHLIAKHNGIDFHLYQCRHTFITTLFMKGIDIKTIQEIVGQKVDATTIGYIVADKERIRNAVELI